MNCERTRLYLHTKRNVLLCKGSRRRVGFIGPWSGRYRKPVRTEMVTVIRVDISRLVGDGQ